MPRALSKALRVQRRLCGWMVRGTEVPLLRPFLLAKTWPRTTVGASAQDTVTLVSRVTNGMRRKRPS